MASRSGNLPQMAAWKPKARLDALGNAPNKGSCFNHLLDEEGKATKASKANDRRAQLLKDQIDEIVRRYDIRNKAKVPSDIWYRFLDECRHVTAMQDHVYRRLIWEEHKESFAAKYGLEQFVRGRIECHQKAMKKSPELLRKKWPNDVTEAKPDARTRMWFHVTKPEDYSDGGGLWHDSSLTVFAATKEEGANGQWKSDQYLTFGTVVILPDVQGDVTLEKILNHLEVELNGCFPAKLYAYFCDPRFWVDTDRTTYFVRPRSGQHMDSYSEISNERDLRIFFDRIDWIYTEQGLSAQAKAKKLRMLFFRIVLHDELDVEDLSKKAFFPNQFNSFVRYDRYRQIMGPNSMKVLDEIDPKTLSIEEKIWYGIPPTKEPSRQPWTPPPYDSDGNEWDDKYTMQILDLKEEQLHRFYAKPENKDLRPAGFNPKKRLIPGLPQFIKEEAEYDSERSDGEEPKSDEEPFQPETSLVNFRHTKTPKGLSKPPAVSKKSTIPKSSTTPKKPTIPKSSTTPKKSTRPQRSFLSLLALPITAPIRWLFGSRQQEFQEDTASQRDSSRKTTSKESDTDSDSDRNRRREAKSKARARKEKAIHEIRVKAIEEIRSIMDERIQEILAEED